MPPKQLFGLLSTHGWLYRRTGNKNWLAYQNKLNAQLLQHKVITLQLEDGTEKIQSQVLVTPKGLAHLAKTLGVSQSLYIVHLS